MRILVLSAVLVLAAGTAMACPMSTTASKEQTVAQPGSSNAPQMTRRPANS